MGNLHPLTTARKVFPPLTFKAQNVPVVQASSGGESRLDTPGGRGGGVSAGILKTCVCVGPAGSSTDVSEDWEKDFDLDMTEEEVQMALSKIQSSGEVRVFFRTSLLYNKISKVHFGFMCFSFSTAGRGLGELGLRDTVAPALSLHESRSRQTKPC